MWYKQDGGKKLIMPICIRWNIFYDSIEFFLRNSRVLIQMCQAEKNDDKNIHKMV